MLRRTKKQQLGFTLIELLVATAILGGLAILSTQLLWDTVSTRSKQLTIEGSSDNFRFIISTLTKAIQGANSVKVPTSTRIEITDSSCQIIRWNATTKTIEKATSASCVTPGTFTPITKEEISVQTLDFSPVNALSPTSVVTIRIQGTYKDNLGEHPVNFETTVTPRITI